MSAPLLRAEAISFSYGALHIVKTWLRGANGSGKSTLLKLLAGALDPYTGRRVAGGIDAAADGMGYRRQVFWCGPGAPAFDHLRAPEFFAFMAALYPRFSDAALAEAVQGLQLTPFLAVRISQLSSGNQRKVWLAAALAAGTPVVLLDEPLNALDAASLAWLRGRLRQHAEAAEQAWLVASHEPPVPEGPQQCLDLPLP